MPYVALYRTYRPKKFCEVAGQKSVVKILQNALLNNKIAHAYLFAGPRGTGKTSVAKIFAKAINCLNMPATEPCGVCDVCIGIDSNEIVDIIEIDAASNTGIDNIRELRDNARYAPGVTKYKVYIIDEVHMLSNNAFNALLKILEEPPKNVIFILATTEIHEVLPTIISRCQRFDFKNLDEKEIIDKLNEVIKKEKIKISPQAVRAIALNAEGGMRDALSLLDQLTSFTDDIGEDDVFSITGGISSKTIESLLLAIYNKQANKAIEITEKALDDGKDISKMVSDIILALRDCLLDKVRKDHFYPKLINIPNDYIFVYLEIINELQNNLKFTTQKRTYFEMAIFQMIDHQTINSLDLHKKVSDLEDKVKNHQAYQVAAPSSHKAIDIKQQTPLVTIVMIQKILHEADRIHMKRSWDENDLSDINPIAKKLLDDATLVAGSPKYLLFSTNDLKNAQSMYTKAYKKGILAAIHKGFSEIKDFYVILDSDWDDIQKEYKQKYSKINPKPTLANRDLKLYVAAKKQEENDILNEAIAIFGQDLVSIKE